MLMLRSPWDQLIGKNSDDGVRKGYRLCRPPVLAYVDPQEVLITNVAARTQSAGLFCPFRRNMTSPSSDIGTDNPGYT